jgi:hypothetical protein
VQTALAKADASDAINGGRFVLESVLCSPVPEPPADLDTSVKKTTDGDRPLTERELLAYHRRQAE